MAPPLSASFKTHELGDSPLQQTQVRTNLAQLGCEVLGLQNLESELCVVYDRLQGAALAYGFSCPILPGVTSPRVV